MDLEVRNCGECYFVSHCAEYLGRLAAVKDELTQAAIDENVDTAVAPAIRELLMSNPELAEQLGYDGESEDEIAGELRRSAADVLNILDEQAEALVALTNAGTAACGGPLKMRASKAGTTTMAVICNNPLIPAGEQTETVVLRRSR